MLETHYHTDRVEFSTAWISNTTWPTVLGVTDGPCDLINTLGLDQDLNDSLVKFSLDLFPFQYDTFLLVSRLRYKGYFGGVTALTKEQFERVNGFPNNYWGWGGEDDDLRIRSDPTASGHEHQTCYYYVTTVFLCLVSNTLWMLFYSFATSIRWGCSSKCLSTNINFSHSTWKKTWLRDNKSFLPLVVPQSKH